MPFARPTLQQLISAAVQDVVTADLQDSSGNTLTQQLLQKAVLRVLATVLAGLASEEYGFLDEISLQANPFTATGEFAQAWGALKGVYPEDATAAVLTITFTGAALTDIPAGTALTRNSDGAGYATTADASIPAAGTSVNVTAAATTPGSAGNCTPGTAIAIANAIQGINATGSVVSTVTDGADQETQTAFKTRYLAVYANPPQGGSVADYVEWAEQVPGVTRAWCNPMGAGAGTVVVYVMFDLARASGGGFPVGSNGVSANDNSGNPRGTVATGDQLEVANYIEVLQPVTALVTVCAPGQFPINFSIAALGAANTAATQALISASLAGMLNRIGSPLSPTIYPSAWIAAIAAVPAVTTFNVTVPGSPVVVPFGYLPVLGSVGFSS